jgi:hypothetical protein
MESYLKKCIFICGNLIEKFEEIIGDPIYGLN